jgi:hypothetical protein
MTGADDTGIDRDLAEKALADAGQWTRFADPKAATLFPRLKRQDRSSPSLYYFADIAAKRSADTYVAALRSASVASLDETIALQAFEVARIARAKNRAVSVAFLAVLAFLVCWAVARLALALAR